MIVVVSTGTSFKGAHAYLSHDKSEKDGPKATTAERLAWTHTLNLLENDPDEAVREMQKTCFDAPMLKQMSGNRIDGRPCAKPVMTVSLSWAQGQQPTQAQMIEAAQGYLKKMGWQDLQAQLYAHNDTEHPHLHLLVNRIHPDTGMAADNSWVKHRSNQWALGYEREQGQVLCPARVGKYESGERITTASMSRAEWETWRHISQQALVADRKEHVAALKSGEWDSLKDAQRDERLAFWKESGRLRRELRTEIVREVKGQFAEDWAYYAEHRDHRQAYQREQDAATRRGIRHLRRHGGGNGEGIKRLEEKQAAQHAAMREELKAARQPILDAQKACLAKLGTQALADLGKERAAVYHDLLATQRGEKAQLHTDQAAGVRRYDLLDRQHGAANKVAEASRPAPAQPPERLETGFVERGKAPLIVNRQPASRDGVRNAEAVRRAHEHGSSPIFPANQNRPPPPRERRAADQLATATQETTQRAAAFDMTDFLNRQQAAGDASRAAAKPAPRGEVTDRRAARQNDDARPKSDRQAFMESVKAQSRQRGVERGDDDGGRGRDR